MLWFAGLLAVTVAAAAWLFIRGTLALYASHCEPHGAVSFVHMDPRGSLGDSDVDTSRPSIGMGASSRVLAESWLDTSSHGESRVDSLDRSRPVWTALESARHVGPGDVH